MLWLGFALLVLVTLVVLLWPLWRPSAFSPRSAYDLAVYRAQLAELDADVARGLVASDQAESAKLEIQHRMLAAPASAAPADDKRARRTAAIVIAITVPTAALLLYASLGNPQLPDRPYAERLKHDPAVILTTAAEKMETALAAKPTAAGYRRLSDLYFQMRDFPRAATATEHVLKLDANNAADWATLGEMRVFAAGGAVLPQALGAFLKALEREPREPRARFYVGLAQAQTGRLKEAVATWRDLENDSKADAPWLPALRDQIKAAGTAGKFDPASIPPASPSPENLRAALAAMKVR